MSQRNPMNDRYTNEKTTVGKTRKSAASAKPKSKAAASVQMPVKEKPKRSFFSGKTQEERDRDREERWAKRDERRELNRKYYTVPTAEYRRWRRIWWGLIIATVVFGVITFASAAMMPGPMLIVFLVITYACAVAAIFTDSRKIRKIRGAYQRQMVSTGKAKRAEEKERKAAERKARKEREAAAKEAAKNPQPEPKKGLFGRKKKNTEANAAKSA